MLGGLRLALAGRTPPSGERLQLTGDLADGTLRVTALRADPLLPESGGQRRLVVECYAQLTGDRLQLGQGMQAALGPTFGDPPAPDQLAVVELTLDAPNTLTALGWHPASAH